jgi:ATP-dependent DNA helicase RecG
MDKDIEPINFEEFRIAAGLSPALDNYQIIRNLKLTLPDTTFKNGGVLFFASSPESFFEKAVIRCVAFGA